MIRSPKFSKFWPHFSFITLRPPSDCLFKLAEIALIALFKYMCTFNCDHSINESDYSGWWGVRECLCYLLLASWLAEAEHFDLVLHEWRYADSSVTDTLIKEELLCLFLSFCTPEVLQGCHKLLFSFSVSITEALDKKCHIHNDYRNSILQYWKVKFICLFSCPTEIVMVIIETNPFFSFLLRMLFWPCMLLQPLNFDLYLQHFNGFIQWISH